MGAGRDELHPAASVEHARRHLPDPAWQGQGVRHGMHVFSFVVVAHTWVMIAPDLDWSPASYAAWKTPRKFRCYHTHHWLGLCSSAWLRLWVSGCNPTKLLGESDSPPAPHIKCITFSRHGEQAVVRQSSEHPLCSEIFSVLRT